MIKPRPFDRRFTMIGINEHLIHGPANLPITGNVCEMHAKCSCPGYFGGGGEKVNGIFAKAPGNSVSGGIVQSFNVCPYDVLDMLSSDGPIRHGGSSKFRSSIID